MKKAFIFTMMVVISIVAFAQKDVTTFLGIPVDGFKKDMKQKLIQKGFEPKVDNGVEFFNGEFNGHDVNVFIVTNNNKVFRIMVSDVNILDEANIKIRFNTLVNQFEKNKRYTSIEDYSIPEDEDISYEMLVNHKIYEAVYYQNIDMEKVDTLHLYKKIHEDLREKYTEEQLQNSSEEIELAAEDIFNEHFFALLQKKSVWFRICEQFGKYYISMFYDNEYNHADGEDL